MKCEGKYTRVSTAHVNIYRARLTPKSWVLSHKTYKGWFNTFCHTLPTMVHLMIFFKLICVLMVVRIRAGISEEQKKIIVDKHNELRSKVVRGEVPGQPPSCDMKMLTWDDELAKTAEKWSSQCQLGHDKLSNRRTEEFFYVGQNFGASWNLENIMNAWFDEYSKYNYEDLTCSGVCGHYTQMIWANTTKIGCSITDCSAPEKNFIYGQTVVCNYGEAGNWNNYKPYITCPSGPCSICAEGTTCNGDKLCAKDCIFPFQFKGEWNSGCIGEDKKWCSFDRKYKGVWKYCN